MKIIYILNSCNEWKETSSMILVTATTSIRKIKSIIIQEIKDGNMEYNRKGDISTTKQIKALKEDWAEYGSDFVFNALEYGYVEIVEDGEVL